MVEMKPITGITFAQIERQEKLKSLLKRAIRPYTIPEIALELKASPDEVIMTIRALCDEDAASANEYLKLVVGNHSPNE